MSWHWESFSWLVLLGDACPSILHWPHSQHCPCNSNSCIRRSCHLASSPVGLAVCSCMLRSLALSPSTQMLKVLCLCAIGAFGFPITSLEVTKAQFLQLNSSGDQDPLATSLLLPELRRFFSSAQAAISVGPGDIIIENRFPDTVIDDNCHHKVEALNGHAKGDVRNTSFLTGRVKVSWRSVSVFVDAELVATLDIGGDVRVRVGEEIFGHHCTQLARKTMGLNVDSDGKNGVGINMTASNARLEHLNGTWYLAFNFHADVVGTVLEWNVDKITAHGCKIKILDVEIASVCGYVERHVKDKLQSLLNSVERIDAPKILHKLEEKINTEIGSVVKIPLNIPAEGLVI
ncbi:unnamed protein product [Durusdinium trenchii]|uniref:Uncharacterized protein n=1 Tax=Durusdinium trenchii TaxID=1381693 RepID=A0ABP0R7M5_9DINO